MKKPSFKASLTALASLALLSGAPSLADGIFRPTAFKVTFYEIGLRDSASGTRNPVFQNASGIQADLSSAKTLDLASGVTPSAGTWDQLYALVGNTIVLGGGDGTGCFIRSGASDTDTDGTFEIVTNNAALSGEGTTIEPSFGGSLGPNTPAVTTNVNGSAVTGFTQYLVSSSNPLPGGGGTIDRFLFVGTLGSPVTIKDKVKGTIIYTVDTSQALQITGGCGSVNYANTKFNMSVEQ